MAGRRSYENSRNNPTKAVVDIARSLSNVFKKYTISRRRKAWDDITSREGKKEIEKLLRNPNRPLNTFQKLAFKEWLEANRSAV